MVFTPYHNITGSTGVTSTLVDPSENLRAVNSINVSNIHATATATVSVFIQDNPTSGTASVYYMVKNVKVPAGVSFMLDESIPLSKGSTKYGLYITVGASDTVDVIMKK